MKAKFSFDQAGFFGAAVDDKPGVDCDAVPADAGPRAQNVDARVEVCEFNQFPDVEVKAFADN